MSDYGQKKSAILFKADFTDTSGFGGVTGMSVLTTFDDDSATTDTVDNLTEVIAGEQWTVEITPSAVVGGRKVKWSFTDALGASVVLFDYFRVTEFLEDDLPSETWDEILTGGTHNIPNSSGRILRQIQEAGNYNGYIWLNTITGTPGDVPFENGTENAPVNTLADALSLAVALKIFQIKVSNGSSVLLTSDMTNYTMEGINWTLALNGQQISGASFSGAIVTGIGLNGGDNPEFRLCFLGDVSLPGFNAVSCGLTGTIVITEAADYILDGCFSAIAGVSTPAIDFGVSVSSTDLSLRHYSGGIEIKNMGQAGTDNMSLEGQGQYIVNANCVGGLLAVRGAFSKTDNSGAVTIVDDANIYSGVIHTGRAQGGTVNTITLSSLASSDDGAYDPAQIALTAGPGAGETRLIFQYDATTKKAVVDRDWKVPPTSDTDYKVLAHPGREHVEEGQARGGTSNTITLSETASSINNTYRGGTCFLRSGTGADQSLIVLAYDGSTKIAIVSDNWSILPDATTGYAILPTHLEELYRLKDIATEARLSELDPENLPGDIDAITTLITALNDLSPAEVLTQVDAALDAAIPELPQGQPAAEPNVRTGLMLLYMALRNKFKTETSGPPALKVHNDAGEVIAEKSISDVGGDYTEEKMESGA